VQYTAGGGECEGWSRRGKRDGFTASPPSNKRQSVCREEPSTLPKKKGKGGASPSAGDTSETIIWEGGQVTSTQKKKKNPNQKAYGEIKKRANIFILDIGIRRGKGKLNQRQKIIHLGGTSSGRTLFLGKEKRKGRSTAGKTESFLPPKKGGERTLQLPERRRRLLSHLHQEKGKGNLADQNQ